MTHETLKTIRISWNYSQGEFAETLRVPYTTYRDWESGKSRIPGYLALLLDLVKERTDRLTKEIIARAEERIRREYPDGIMSEIEVDDES
jgi:transcriptional regulator with XRE-family HTH domain